MTPDTSSPSRAVSPDPAADVSGTSARPPAAPLCPDPEFSPSLEQQAPCTALPPGIRRLFFWFFIGLLGFSLYLLYILMRPFLDSIILGCVFTAICYPLYVRCLRLTRQHRIPAAIIVLAAMTFLVVLPITLFLSGLVPQAVSSVSAITRWLNEGHLTDTVNTYINPFLAWADSHFPDLDLGSVDIRTSLLDASRNMGRLLLSSGTHLVGNTVLFVFHFLLILLIMFFLLIDGAVLVQRLKYIFPLKPQQTGVVIESLRRISKAVLVGGFCVAALQGIVGGIGLAIVGIPPLFWGTLMAFAALVPVVGTGLVWVPALAYLLIMGEWKSAIFLAIWCGVLVSGIDSFLRPILMRESANVPILFIFLAILGGVNVFGMLGILYGPMILAFVAVMLDLYAEEYHTILQSRGFTGE